LNILIKLDCKVCLVFEGKQVPAKLESDQIRQTYGY